MRRRENEQSMTEGSLRQPSAFFPLPSPHGSSSRVDKALEALLALGVILSSASQLRVAGVPLGPGEACLFGWSGLRVARAVLDRRGRSGAAGRAVPLFWVLFAIAQSIGLLRAMSTNVPIDWSLTLHDTSAYVLIALISSFCLSGEDVGASLRRLTLHLLAFAAISLFLQIASGLGLFPALGVGSWYWDRFRGWADNPNQLSLFCTIITAIAVFVVETAARRADRLIALASAMAALAAGIMTQGNTLRLSLALGACVFVVILFLSLALRRERAATMPVLAFVLAVATMPAMLLSMLPYTSQLSAKDLAQQVSRDQGETVSEADLRFMLWSGATQSGIDSLFLGLGPGPHAPVPIDVALRRVWDADGSEESLGLIAKHADFMESHNTYIELFSQGGALVIAAYAWLLMRAARHSLRSGSAALPALLCVLLIFGMFHVMVRHPIVWLALCLCLGSQVGPPRPRFRPLSAAETRSAIELAPG